MITHRLARFAVPAALVFSLAACEDPAKDKTKATVSSAAPVTTTAAAAPSGPAETAALDAAGSTVGFTGSKVTGSHSGKFEKVAGEVTLVGGKIEGGKVTISADVDSVKTDAEKLDGHLKSPDFFDAAKFPKATFTSAQIKAAAGPKGESHSITGELDLHGVKKTISFPATITVSGDAVSGTAEFTINRKDFGIVYAGKADDLIRDDVVLKLTLKANRKKG
ncbi:Rhodanese-like domain protein [Minicystis rosea]|nr:Rhodanese-like domain protein [Minicystis rosea]